MTMIRGLFQEVTGRTTYQDFPKWEEAEEKNTSIMILVWPGIRHERLCGQVEGGPGDYR